ncbi:MAG: cysteine desulfurase family protein [Candidatus Hadarchaeum sp.]
MKKPIYLDYNGTTPHDPEVIAAMKPFIEEEFGNPSSTHWYGIKPKKALLQARKQVASLLNCSPEEIVFTSGGTESNNYAIKGVAFANRYRGNHIITSQIEHPAVLEVCRHLETQGFYITYLPVDEFGLVSPSEVEAVISRDTILITIMHSNNEVGTIQPIEEIADIAKKHGVIIHTDAAQSVGKVKIDVQKHGVDLLSIAGHKLYAPKGVGALYVKNGIKLEKFMLGASQEGGRRAGTENVTQIVGLGKACEIAKRDFEHNHQQMKMTRDMLYEGLKSKVQAIKLNGHPQKRLPNTLNVSFYGLEANTILEEIGLEIAASAGAACHSEETVISHVLEAMKVPMEWVKGTLRLTTGKMTTEKEIMEAVDIIASAVNHLTEIRKTRKI